MQDDGTDISDAALEDDRDVPQTYQLTTSSSSSSPLDVSVKFWDDAVKTLDSWAAIGDPAILNHMGAQFDQNISYPQRLSL